MGGKAKMTKHTAKELNAKAAQALTDRGGERRGVRLLLGLVSLVSGTVVVAWPTPTLTVVAWIAGLHLVFFGVLLVASALSLRRLVHDVEMQ